ncbi:MAG: hypothetical protein ACI9LU_002421 [Polaribacter sp.]|jgi:hypothetical protein
MKCSSCKQGQLAPVSRSTISLPNLHTLRWQLGGVN